MALQLSLYNILLSYFFPNSSINLYNQIISLLAFVEATYSTFFDESETTFCSFKIKPIDVPPIVKTYLMMLLLLSLSPTISESTCPYRIVFDPPKHNDCVIVPLKYTRMHFTTTPTSFAIDGLVHAITYIKLPIADEYGTLDM